jgi:chromate transporter
MFDKLFEVIKLFLKLGLIAFGGPAAHIAMMHREVIDKRKWMDEEHFLDLVGATSLIPGPNSTEMVIHCGYHRAGLKGLFAAGISFILPATLLTGILAYFYVKLSGLPNFESYLVGIKPVVIILILDALRKLWKKAAKSKELISVAMVVFILGLINIGEVYALFIGALLGFSYIKAKSKFSLMSIAPLSIFTVFLKIGSVLFGSGYVLIAYLQDEIVHNRGWLTTAQLADAIAIGQFTPGPVLSTSTFVGYILGSSNGAILATVGIFLPSFLFVWLLTPLIPKMRASKNFSILLDSINAGAIGLMAYALVPLAKISLTNTSGIITFVIMGAIYLKWQKLSSFYLVAISSILGFLISLYI